MLLNDLKFLLVNHQLTWHVEEAEGAHPVLHCDDDDVLLSREDGRLVDGEGGGAAHVAAAIDPHEKWRQFFVVPLLGRSPNVQVQTVFRNVGVRIPHLLALKSREVFIALLGDIKNSIF